MSWVINAYVWFSSCKTHTEHCSNTKIDFHFSHYYSWRTEDKNCALNYTVNLLHIVIFIDWFLHAGKKDLVSQNYLRFNSRHEWFCLFNLFTNTKNRPTHTKALSETSNHHRSPYLVGKFVQNSNLKFLGNSCCKSRFILYKRLWIFFASILSQKDIVDCKIPILPSESHRQQFRCSVT